MTDQTYITDDGQIGSQPLTWDGEPLYSPETVKEGLFDPSAFEQQPGQLAITWQPPCGSPVCAQRECCMGRADCPCGIGDDR